MNKSPPTSNAVTNSVSNFSSRKKLIHRTDRQTYASHSSPNTTEKHHTIRNPSPIPSLIMLQPKEKKHPRHTTTVTPLSIQYHHLWPLLTTSTRYPLLHPHHPKYVPTHLQWPTATAPAAGARRNSPRGAQSAALYSSHGN